ncbi:DUF421 domain-containing protein [Vaginella massiliensis]|uniref:DUF421 domain-containing protein n=1 Tax=Vaginella massiliensis TaxID=1816680 RepID=UPI003751A5C7
MKHLFYNNLESLLHVFICAIVSYFTLFIFIRISGNRTLAKLNAFDTVVAVTLGSTLSSMILKKNNIVDGTVALSTIILLQFVLASLARKSKKIEKIINSEPTLLFYNGVFLQDAMRKEYITEKEIYAVIRKYRLEDLAHVKAVIMELNGTLTVVKKSENFVHESSLKDLIEK